MIARSGPLNIHYTQDLRIDSLEEIYQLFVDVNKTIAAIKIVDKYVNKAVRRSEYSGYICIKSRVYTGEYDSNGNSVLETPEESLKYQCKTLDDLSELLNEDGQLNRISELHDWEYVRFEADYGGVFPAKFCLEVTEGPANQPSWEVPFVELSIDSKYASRISAVDEFLKSFSTYIPKQPF